MSNHDFEYDGDGRLLSAPIMVAICSPGGGGIDPTTLREYGIYCTSCRSKLFYEDEGGYELRCKSCEAILGVIAINEMVH